MKNRLVYPLIFGVIAMVALNSCATQDMIAKAQGYPGPLDPPNQPPVKPNPAYYALVPVVLPFDLVAWPFQYWYLNNRPQYVGVPEPTGPPPGYYQGPPPPPPGPNTPYQPGN